MADQKRGTSNEGRRAWIPIVIQTICLLGVIIGFAVANEHRITSLEVGMRNSIEQLADVCGTVEDIQRNQIKVLLLIDQIEKRHEREDRAASRGRNQ